MFVPVDPPPAPPPIAVYDENTLLLPFDERPPPAPTVIEYEA
jgi:hypothetical protein